MFKKIVTLSIVYLSFPLLLIGHFPVRKVQQQTILYDRGSKSTEIAVAGIVQPKTIGELIAIVKSSKTKLSIAGARFSQGGQIGDPEALMIDMENLNKVIELDIKNKRITVEAGITWAELQAYIDPYNLSVPVMQSFNDFSVGGSLSVNVHGRDITHGPLIETVHSIKMILADGTLVSASRSENNDLFCAAIGGYGLLGIIVEATLDLTENIPLKLEIQKTSVVHYQRFFTCLIKEDPRLVLHNASLAPHDLDTIVSYGWVKTDEQPAENCNRLRTRKKFYPKDMAVQQVLRRVPAAHRVRPTIEPLLQTGEVVYRNFEMGYSVNMLAPLFYFPTTTILQEYFVPIASFEQFVYQFRAVVKQYGINLVNISIRYLSPEKESLLSYTPQESFSFVLFINIANTAQGKKQAELWTQKLIDEALHCGGSYYLPYHLYATPAQFNQAYKNAPQFKQIKQKFDPENRFVNGLFRKYIEQL
jgi:FAD/FMN-containing dehydrogenase